MRSDIDALAASLAARQHGVFARRQLAEAGASRHLIARRIAAGTWQPVALGVLRDPSVRPSWKQRVMARCLTWGPDAVASHATAMALWELPPFRPGPIETTVPRGRNRAAPTRGVHFVRLASEETAVRDGIPVTTVARSLLDVAPWISYDRLEMAADEALRRGLLSLAALADLVDITRAGKRGVAALRRLIRDRQAMAVAGSPFETMLLAEFRRAGLPRPEAQHSVFVDGALVAVADFAFVAERVIVEADGFAFHAGRAQFDHDRRRRNRLVLAGWTVIQVTWTDFVRDRQRPLDMIAGALRARRNA